MRRGEVRWARGLDAVPSLGGPDSVGLWLVLGALGWSLVGMGKCYDKAADLAQTKLVMAGNIPATRNGASWLRHTKEGAEVDRLLAKGATAEALRLARDSWKQHRHHLRTEHGLGIEEVEGLWRFTGEPHVPGEGGSKKDITDEQYRAGYIYGRRVIQGLVTDEEGVAAQVKIGTNETSASFMLEITKGLLSGQVFKRALKYDAYGWYLDWIFQDDGPEGLRKALKAAWAHLEYREEDGAKHPRIRAILEHFEKVLAGESDQKGDASKSAKEREKKKALVELRYGQPEFRKKLLKAYSGRCAVTGCRVERALVAAHVKPYALDGASSVANGMLLRADVHALFDAYLLGIDPDDGFAVKVSPSLLGSEYEKLRRFALPAAKADFPDAVELREHLKRVLSE